MTGNTLFRVYTNYMFFFFNKTFYSDVSCNFKHVIFQHSAKVFEKSTKNLPTKNNGKVLSLKNCCLRDFVSFEFKSFETRIINRTEYACTNICRRRMKHAYGENRTLSVRK